jgi:hypothetical protein
MQLARMKIGTNSTETMNNWLRCFARRQKKDFTCRLVDRLEPFNIVPQTTIYPIEPFQIREMTFKRETGDRKNCSFQLSFYNPGANFYFPDLAPLVHEQNYSRISPVTTCALRTWDCLPWASSSWNQLMSFCGKNNEVVLNYNQDKERRMVELRPVIYSYTPTGFTLLNSVGLLPISMQPEPGFGATCTDTQCTWKNLTVPRRIDHYRVDLPERFQGSS